MSAQNTPSHRPVQHNPYASTPPLGPVRPPATMSPPAEGVRASPGPQTDSSAIGPVGTRFSAHTTAGGHHESGTPRSGPAFMSGYSGYSMYVATPQHTANNNASGGTTIPARMSPGPALGPAATTGGSAPGTSADGNGRSGSVGAAASEIGVLPSYDSLIGRVSPHPAPSSASSAFGTGLGSGGSTHQSVFGTGTAGGGGGNGGGMMGSFLRSSYAGSASTLAGNDNSSHHNDGGGWSVAAQHHNSSSSSAIGSAFAQGFHGFPPYGGSTSEASSDRSAFHHHGGGGGGGGGMSRFSLHDPDQVRHNNMRFGGGGGGGGGAFGGNGGHSTFGGSHGGSEESGHGSLPLLMQGVPRLTPYTQPSYAQQQQQNQGGHHHPHHQHHGQQHQHHGGGGSHHHSHHQSSGVPAQMPTAGSANSASGSGGNGPRAGASAHVFLMHKLRYIPLASEYFIQQPRHQQQQQQPPLQLNGGGPGPMGGGNGALGNGGNMMMHPMMQPDRPIQMFNGRGRPLQEFCPTADLFVAQLPFNMELTALQYLFDMVSQVPADIIHAAPHYKRGRSYDGCAFVKVSQNVAAILVDTFHKAALFDEEGVWVADTPEQRTILANYCGFMQQKSPQERRALLRKPIPFSAMTVEFANRSYAF